MRMVSYRLLFNLLFRQKEMECDNINMVKVHNPYVCDISISRVKFSVSLLPFSSVEIKSLIILSDTSLIVDNV